ncbi:MAG: tyrosine-type recombinase/integrase [Actinomycetota bacterium]|jgi:integrase|nr:tyrosine-type recombinase/integrase [Actinomycetota bacterium]
MSHVTLFGQFAERWITEVAPLRLKSTAVAEYASLLRLHVLPFFADRPVAEISADEIQGYMASKVESGLSPRSVRNHLAVLRALLKSALAFGLIDTNVAMKVTAPRHYRQEQRFPTPGEMRAILESCPPAWRLGLALPIYSACRKGEALGLRWPAVSIPNRQIAFVRSVRGGVEQTVKSPASRSSVAMAEELVPLLLDRRKVVPDPVNGYVLCDSSGAPLKDHILNGVLRRACKKAGVEHFTYHQLRHGSIAALIASGVHPLVVSRFARHASVSTTFDEYGHLLAPLAGGDCIADLSRVISGS